MSYIEIQAMMQGINWDKVAENYAISDMSKEYKIILEV